MTVTQLNRLAAELGLDVVGAAPAAPYEATERHIRERRSRGLFAGMRFTMARPEVSCHPERLLPGARTVVAAAVCVYAEAPPPAPGEGRLPRYAWHDAYAELRERLEALGRRIGGSYRVLVDANQHVDREAAARSGVGFYGRNTMPCQDVCPWNRGVERRRAGLEPPAGAEPAVSLGNAGGPEHLPAIEEYLDDPDPLVREHAEWAAARLRDRHGTGP